MQNRCHLVYTILGDINYQPAHCRSQPLNLHSTCHTVRNRSILTDVDLRTPDKRTVIRCFAALRQLRQIPTIHADDHVPIFGCQHSSSVTIYIMTYCTMLCHLEVVLALFHVIFTLAVKLVLNLPHSQKPEYFN